VTVAQHFEVSSRRQPKWSRRHGARFEAKFSYWKAVQLHWRACGDILALTCGKRACAATSPRAGSPAYRTPPRGRTRRPAACGVPSLARADRGRMTAAPPHLELAARVRQPACPAHRERRPRLPVRLHAGGRRCAPALAPKGRCDLGGGQRLVRRRRGEAGTADLQRRPAHAHNAQRQALRVARDGRGPVVTFAHADGRGGGDGVGHDLAAAAAQSQCGADERGSCAPQRR
jgi:hypothetical protein